MAIHPTAIVDRRAEIGAEVDIGPFCIIDAGVAVGAGCRLHQGVHLTGRARIGAGCELHAGVLIGHAPQDVKHRGEESFCRIGERNIIREYSTIHRATGEGQATTLGDDNFLLSGAHIGHNCTVGNRVTMVNGAKLAGHVQVADRVTFGADALVHQFVRVGALAMIAAAARVAMDIPPFMLTDHDGLIAGLNSVGLRRAGLSQEQILDLRRAFHLLYRQSPLFRQGVGRLAESKPTGAAAELLKFLEAPSRRGVTGVVRRGGGEDVGDESF
ncbi:MAG: acyl-ACP--UDP-N-acetylglucosamine O-acyltransferase [Phycisphaerales bacterium]|nr:acyl-ACP--UDP-N-acetylglucosamine O-acyltransferase [Phycisphaerales bacterium]